MTSDGFQEPLSEQNDHPSRKGSDGTGRDLTAWRRMFTWRYFLAAIATFAVADGAKALWGEVGYWGVIATVTAVVFVATRIRS